MQRKRHWIESLCLAVSVGFLVSSCGSAKPPGPSEPSAAPSPATAPVAGSKIRPADKKKSEPTAEAIEEAQAELKRKAKAQRGQWQGRTFEEFERSVYKESGEGGKYIVNGDTPFSDRKQLEEFFNTRIKQDPPETRPGALILGRAGGQDLVWNSTQKKQITYCVSTTFGNRQGQVVAAIEDATGAWEKVADVKFTHIASADANCTASTASVVFDVRPVNVNGQYLARAFFPNEPRASRNVLIDDTSFALDPPPAKLQLVGILRHELGHSLGWRHEHTRPESGTCFEDTEWRPITDYDKFSVMHYPQCNGGGDWSLTLTDMDKSGAACVYGAAPGFQVNPALCQGGGPTPPPPAPCGPKTEVFSDQQVSKGADKAYAAFTVSPGTRFEAKMTGKGTSPGDPDLYVQFGQAPTLSTYACRPYLTGADETCSLDVPAGKTKAFVMVHGYAAGMYDLVVTRNGGGQP